DVRYLLYTAVFGCQDCSADYEVGESHLAGPSAVHAVCFGESGDQPSAVLRFATKENPVPGDENIVENHGGGLALAEYRVSKLRLVFGHLSFGRVCIVLADVSQSGRSVRDGKGNSEVLLALLERPAGKNERFVRPYRPALADLCAPDDDPVAAFLGDVYVHVRFVLLGRAFSPVALGVGYRPGNGEIFLL